MGTSPPKISTRVRGAVTEIAEFDCDTLAAVDDLVRVSATVNAFVDVVIDNQDARPVIGRIYEKITSTRCKVILRGVIDVSSLLATGRIILGTSGEFTHYTTNVLPGYVQELGYCFGNGKMHLQPNAKVTLRG